LNRAPAVFADYYIRHGQHRGLAETLQQGGKVSPNLIFKFLFWWILERKLKFELVCKICHTEFFANFGVDPQTGWEFFNYTFYSLGNIGKYIKAWEI
jgi:hypothetical protein